MQEIIIIWNRNLIFINILVLLKILCDFDWTYNFLVKDSNKRQFI